MLCEASKRDANLQSDQDGYTPTLVAAQNGNLDALRILVGRGGNPEKTLVDGSSALHLAAMKNHLNCVSFLVNFGVNMWALDNELRTAKDVAAIKQKKEVLDYLDQMMAKQSALSTKTVQRLKEKAKSNAEKRLKQLRKAQLKAIRRFEKDERYLIRISGNNSRLLKAAHSISDIKLVGRIGGMLDYGSGRLSSDVNSSVTSRNQKDSRLTPLAMSSSISASSDRLSSSPSFSNLLSNSKLDLLSHNRRAKHMNLLTSISTYTSATDDSSAYSSASVSSSSGYLSSVGSGSVALPVHSIRPKYSDLVAVNGCPETSVVNKKSMQQNNKFVSKHLSNKQQSAQSSSEQQSLRSSSSLLGTKLWPIGSGGGVSRKVQLKRMLFGSTGITNNNSSSIANLHETAIIQQKQEDESNLTTASSNQFLCSSAKDSNDNYITTTARNGTLVNKLCNVQPAIKLKLNSNLCNTNTGEQQQGIKWPAAPTMTRAVSEPDFGAALRSDEEIEGDSSKRVDAINTIAVYKEENSVTEEVISKQSQEQTTTSQAAQPKSPTYKPKVEVDANKTMINKQQQVTVESQHHLLTQCLSQLKLRHEAISRQQCNETTDVLIKPSKLAISFSSPVHLDEKQQVKTAKVVAHRQQAPFGNSDELLQLCQLNTGNFPLKPSAIKLQQQQQQQLQQQQHTPINNTIKQEASDDDSTKYYAAGKLATISTDSIGSAGSFAQRNCRPDVSSPEYPQPVTDHNFPLNFSSSSSSLRPESSSSSSSSSISTYATGIAMGSSTNSVQTGSDKSSGHNRAHNECITIEQFLSRNSLSEFGEVLGKEKIDLEALMLLTEEDMKSLGLLLGPRRKLLHAIQDYRKSQQAKIQLDGIKLTSRPSIGLPNKPMYMVVDTSL